jgi:hypothetical protein
LSLIKPAGVFSTAARSHGKMNSINPLSGLAAINRSGWKRYRQPPDLLSSVYQESPNKED